MNFRDRDMKIDDVINHIRNREYMSGVERDKSRVRSTGEVFTPYELVLNYIDQCEKQNTDAFTNPDENFCDNSCGDGQFLGEILIRKMERGVQFESALRSIHGVDFQESNVELCKQRLLCGRNDLRHIVDMNIVCADSTQYHYRFDGTYPYSKTWQEYEAIIAEKDQEIDSRREGKASDKLELGKKKATIRYRNETIEQQAELIRALEADYRALLEKIRESNGISIGD